MTITTDDLETTEYLEQLARFTGPNPNVDVDARWGLTAAGATALGHSVHGDARPGDPVYFVPSGNQHPGRWMIDMPRVR